MLQGRSTQLFLHEKTCQPPTDPEMAKAKSISSRGRVLVIHHHYV